MSSGAKQTVANQYERLVSADSNRGQAFANAEVGEVLRYMLDVACGTDDVQAAGTTTETIVSTSPMTGEVLNGLCVQPQVGSLSLLVTPGVLLCVDPDAVPSADDSPYKYVRDAGVTSPTALELIANITTDPYVAVVECQRATSALETALRDVFNPTTGIYTATSVTKVVGSTLNYRIRYGSSGGGFPGTAEGWLPLCVGVLPAGSTTCDQCTFWDVRPLVTDRAFGPGMKVSLASPRRLRGVVNSSTPTATKGIVEVVATDGRRAGGQLWSALAGTASLDLTNADNLDPNMSGTADSVATLALCFPFGLPRWAPYTPYTSGSRLPRSPRGIPVLTPAPFYNDGTPIFAPTLPAALGLGAGSNTLAVPVLHFPWLSNAARQTVGNDAGGHYGVLKALAGTVVGSTTLTGTLAAGTHYPSTAKSVLVNVAVTITSIGAGQDLAQLSVSLPGSATVAYTEEVPFALTATGVTQQTFRFWLPLADAYPSQALSNYDLVFQTGNADTMIAGTFTVEAWRY